MHSKGTCFLTYLAVEKWVLHHAYKCHFVVRLELTDRGLALRLMYGQNNADHSFKNQETRPMSISQSLIAGAVAFPLMSPTLPALGVALMLIHVVIRLRQERLGRAL